ncbi:hypothetical protein C8R46DRAFT_441128 [Mycena filopes]|nr:hypothetical protein C8R46DRAFT_441128 [Mycena filopes]
MEPTHPTIYSYGPFFPGNLPDPTESNQLQTVLRSNGRCAPADSSVDYGGQIAPTLAKVAEYDVEIAKVQAILNRMSVDRSALRYHAEGCDSVSAPIRRLPDEMLLEIFHLCAPLQPISCKYDWREYRPEEPLPKVQMASPRYRYLLTLAQVCASWRNLIMDSPSLWAQIEVDYTCLVSVGKSGYDTKPILADEIFEVLRVFLQRSGVAPLQIHLQSDAFVHVPYGSGFELMAQQSNRWTRAKIWSEDRVPVDGDFAALASVRGNLAQLESLHVGNLPDGCDIFEVAPRLTELTLEEPFPLYPKLPWQQIRTLCYAHLFSTDLGTALSHLSRCPQIERLIILRLYVSDRDEPVILPPLLSDVQSLTFGFTLESHSITKSTLVVELLGCFTLRRAHTLRFETEKSPLFWPHSSFLALCSRSSVHDTLRTLELYNVAISVAQLLECLADLPRLETLSVSDPNSDQYSYRHTIVENAELFLITDPLLRGLTLTAAAANLVPHLHTFECKTFMQFQPRSYLDFIASGVGPGRNATGPFQSFILYFRDVHVDPLLGEGLAEFVRRQELRSRFESDLLESLWESESRFDEYYKTHPIA